MTLLAGFEIYQNPICRFSDTNTPQKGVTATTMLGGRDRVGHGGSSNLSVRRRPERRVREEGSQDNLLPSDFIRINDAFVRKGKHKVLDGY